MSRNIENPSAATIDELFNADYANLEVERNNEIGIIRANAWLESSSAGNSENFIKRLALDSYSYDSALEILSASKINSLNTPPPSQLSIFIDLASAVENLLIEDQEINESTLRQLINNAWRSLSETSKNISAKLLGNLAIEDLKTMLSKRIYELANCLLEAKGKNYRGNIICPPNNPKKNFTAERLFEASISQWVSVVDEFLFRLDSDFQRIASTFFCDSPVGLVDRIETNTSDLHNKGHSVYLLYLQTGQKFVYKPKSLEIDERFYNLIIELNSLTQIIDLKAAKVISMNNYGWSEFISHDSCISHEAVKDFYKRSGCLLALFHILVATDIHEENIIASGAYPIPIDLEMLFQPYDSDEREAIPHRKSYEMAVKSIEDSVAMIGLLPTYKRTNKKQVIINGGFALHRSESSDLLQKSPEEKWLPNFPYFNEKLGDPNNYVDDIIAGFKDYSHFLIQIRENRGIEYIFRRFSGLKVRRVFRPTRFYDLLLRRLKKNIYIQDVALWSAEADFISRFIDWDSDSTSKIDLYKAERDALLELNVPIFFVETDSTALFSSDKFIGIFKGEAGLTRAFKRLHSLDKAEVDHQAEIIQISFGANNHNIEAKEVTPFSDSQNNFDENEKLTNFFIESKKIAEFVSALKIESEDSVSWIGLEWFGNVNVAQLLPLRSDLYSGSLGIAIFLAAFSKVSGEGEYLETSIKSAQFTKHQLLSKNAPRLASNMGIGGSVGIGSVIYGLTLLADLSKDKSFLEDAMRGSRLITSKLINTDEVLDVFSGASGAILSLLALKERVKEPELLEKAILLGDHLVKKISSFNIDSHRRKNSILNGMSHGIAGIAFALSRLSFESGRDDFLKLSESLVCIENESYCKANHNWPDFRVGMHSKNKWSCQWCHGAAGIGLARIGSMQKMGRLASELSANDINAAILKAKDLPAKLSDTLCCGYLGNIELLSEASKLFNRPELRSDALEILHQRFLHRKAAGTYQWEYGPSKYNIGLFKGITGVGYTMLRMIDKELPNLLIWE